MNFNLDLMLPYKKKVTDAILKVVEDRNYILGPNVAAFEDVWSRYNHQRHTIGVGNGTDAIRIALLALGIKPGDEVISPAFNVAYTALAVEAVGAKNVFVDCESSGTRMDPRSLADAVTEKTRAVIAVHLFGQMDYMKELSDFCAHHGLILIEDAAQAHGARDWDGERPGRYSQAVAYSFYPTKNLGALGEAGAITTNIDVVAERARLLRDGGRTDRYLHVLPGINSCLDEMQAAVLNAKFPYMSERNQSRIDAAIYYNVNMLGDVGDLRVPPVTQGHVFHLYVVRTKHRDALHEHLKKRGVPSLVHYPVPVPYQPCFMTATMGGPWPNAEKAAREVLSLPMHADITRAEQDQVISAVKEFYASQSYLSDNRA